MRTVALSLLLAWLAFAPFAEATGTHHWCGVDLQGEPGFRTNDEVFGLADTREWFSRLQRQISEQRGFSNVASALMEQFHDSEMLECTFTVRENGRVENAKIRTSSGSKQIDDLVIHFISGCNGFGDCPNNIPFERGILVEFCKLATGENTHQQIKVFVHINPETSDKPFTVRRYLHAESNR